MKLETWRAGRDLLADLSANEIEFLESVASEVTFSKGAIIFEEDDVADSFYILQEGTVGLELTTPGKPPVVIQTLGSGDLLGVSWALPPYSWTWRARSMTDTTLIAFDAVKVRERCEVDARLAHEILRLIAREAVRRLNGARIRLLDLYHHEAR